MLVSKKVVKIILAISLLLSQLPSFAATLEVGKDKKFKTITSAIAASSDGDVIMVYTGIYGEGEIMVNKKVELRGINFPVLDGKNTSQVLRVISDGVVVEGFEI